MLCQILPNNNNDDNDNNNEEEEEEGEGEGEVGRSGEGGVGGRERKGKLLSSVDI